MIAVYPMVPSIPLQNDSAWKIRGIDSISVIHEWVCNGKAFKIALISYSSSFSCYSHLSLSFYLFYLSLGSFWDTRAANLINSGSITDARGTPIDNNNIFYFFFRKFVIRIAAQSPYRRREHRKRSHWEPMPRYLLSFYLRKICIFKLQNTKWEDIVNVARKWKK